MSSNNSLRSKTLFENIFGVELASSSPAPGSVHNLIPGAPRSSHQRAACGVMQAATQHLMQSEYGASGNIIQYGPVLGSGRFRSEVAKFLSDQYADDVRPECVMQTGGATQGLNMVCMLLLPPGATVYVEDPTYFIAINLLRTDLRLNVVAVPTDEHGIKTDELQKLMEAEEKSRDGGTFNSMVYMVPTHSNPKGICYSQERCETLVRIARTHDALLFCDDVYNMLHYVEDCAAPQRLLTYDKPTDADYKGHVISNGTFSKILGPGVRVGWIETSERIIDLMSASHFLDSGGCVNHFSGEVIAEALSLGLQQQHLCSLRKDYARIVAWVGSLLRERLPECSFHQPQGGYFIWLEMPLGSDATQVAKIAEDEYKLIIMPGNRCSPSGSFRNCIRITFTFLEEDALREAMGRLCDAVRHHLNLNAATSD